VENNNVTPSAFSLDRAIAVRNRYANELEAAKRDERRAEAELERVRRQIEDVQIKLKVAEEMLDAIHGVPIPATGVLSLSGIGKFSGMTLPQAVFAALAEQPSAWVSVPTIHKRLLEEGFQSKSRFLRTAVHTACRRMSARGILGSTETTEGQRFRAPVFRGEEQKKETERPEPLSEFRP
jgi:hypothetical protein